jgi:hypothetical protein
VEKFRLKNILPAENKNLSEGIFIILFNATTLPPHLLLSVNGKIYSITDSGRQMGSSLEKFILFVKRKKIPTILIEWAVKKDFTDYTDLETEIRAVFSKYDKVVAGKVSCLFPIRDVVASLLGNEMKNANFIFELLPLMEKANAIGQSFYFNMENTINSDGSFELLTYNEIDLEEALRSEKKINS